MRLTPPPCYRGEPNEAAKVAKEAKVSEQKLRNIADLAKADPTAVERIIRGESKIRGEDEAEPSCPSGRSAARGNDAGRA